ncbi:hypothetical protein BRADI_2g60252v3 [Brachypodium distachyon]|uniref:Uncharacterized protein n=1 Tax=Brachypodium distachyon TaxID=15368 RepID=A0A0Q3J0F7_BRADI|nr:hypothetical protein BRADI_2g60252v3 [Brachypodium distachyon]
MIYASKLQDKVLQFRKKLSMEILFHSQNGEDAVDEVLVDTRADEYEERRHDHQGDDLSSSLHASGTSRNALDDGTSARYHQSVSIPPAVTPSPCDVS